MVFLYARWQDGSNCLTNSAVTFTHPKWKVRDYAYAKLTIDEKHTNILKYLSQLIAENYKPETDLDELDETDAETGHLHEIQENEEPEHEIDDIIFLENEED